MSSEATTLELACTLATLNSPESGAGAGADAVEASRTGAAMLVLGISAMTRALLSSTTGEMLSAGGSLVYAAPA